MEGLSEEEIKTLRDAGYTDEQINEALQEYNSQSQHKWDSPEPPNKDNALKFYRDVLNLEDEYNKISKIGNLKDEELGLLPVPARDYLDIGLYAENQGLNLVAKYLRDMSNIWFTTSLSRKALFIKLPSSTTQIRKDLGTPKKTVKQGMFGSSTEVIEGGDEN